MTLRRPYLLGAGGIALSASILAACCTERLSPAPERRSTAQPLGIYTTDLPEDPREQARAALVSDARRRELRFFDGAYPGYAFGTTRVPQEEIDQGLWSAADLYQLGGQLFHHRFRRDEGFGAADLPPIARFQTGLRGGPDAYSCTDCHRRGGIAGAGDSSDNAYLYGDGARQETALERNPIALTGAGFIEILAREMSAELASQRTALAARAKAEKREVRGPLSAKGVSFGHLTAMPDGTFITRDVTGVDPDLVVKPFGWKGHTTNLRDVIESELASHHGMQSTHLVTTGAPERIGSFGLPDPDGDGIIDEITEGQLTALTLFVAMQEVPVVEPPIALPDVDLTFTYAEGARRFDELGCSDCHTPSLPLDSTVFVLPHRGGGPELRVDLATEGAMPRLTRDSKTGGYRVWLYSDLKRHDIGSALADAKVEHGIGRSQFLTPRLWGIARSRPYLHDGRAPTLDDAILLHGGEAQASRDAYAALNDHDRGTVRVFLTALTRARRFLSP